jgi:phosphatidyl-myo-inositol dimannoside synthase
MIRKIAIIAPEFTEKKILNVPWRQMFEIAKFLSTKNIEAVIFTEKECPTKIENISIIKLNEKIIRELSDESKMKIESIKPDLIYWMGNTFSGIYMSKNKFKIPLIMHISSVHLINKELRNFSLKEIFTNHKMWLFTSFYPMYRIVSKLNHQNITAIISSSKTISERLEKVGVNNSKINTSPLFFESNFKLEKNSENEEIFSICYAGPVDTIRGTDLVLKTIKILKDQRKNVKLNFLLRTFEKEQDTKKIQTLAIKYKIEDMINIESGILKPEQVREYFSKSHVILLPTKFVWNEPPVTILEAMGIGKVVVTTNVCGLPEMVKGNAILVKPNSNEIAKKIQYLMENKEQIHELEIKAENYVKSLPNWKSLGEWTLKIFQKIIDGKND